MPRKPVQKSDPVGLVAVNVDAFDGHDGHIYGLFGMIDGDDNMVEYVISKAAAEMIIQSAQAFIDIVDGKRPMPTARSQLS
ncbi:hypothetical protein [Aminobacter carboxidus]|nr:MULTISPECIES: hypothetical protein [Aminobacter carboxidus group]MBE1205950.1 hypothetical protein [Aminobacter carboxidus]